ncbi:MAG: SulP family inorganic anion transporter [Alphaproteobacteria bacterium]
MSKNMTNEPQVDVGPVPKDWIPGLIQNARFDVTAGFILFLIALPLSLGIAIASGAPPIAGIIAAVIGGVIGSLCGGSYVTINGAAAGLIAIVYGAVNGLGLDPATGTVDVIRGFRAALAVGVCCGAIQIVMGILRLGKLTNLFPLNVVHGMLAGIGVIIMAKQFHLALGVEVEGGHMWHTFMEIPHSIMHMVPGAAIIGLVSLLIMILWPKLAKLAKIIPAPLVVVAVAIILGQILKLEAIDRSLLVNVPTNIADAYVSPDWSQVATPLFWKFVITYVFVASLESLLTAAAMDKKDPWKRRSNMNLELISKGGTNMLSSFIGGLPMIAEVVRSSANIMSGARTRWANFFHGLFLAIAVVTLPWLLNMIPIAALAGMLVVIGFRLAHPKEFFHAAKMGKEELFYMVLTMLVVVFEDLLMGVAAGFIVAMIVNMVRGVKGVKGKLDVEEANDDVTLRLHGAHGFLNFLALREALDTMPQGKNLTIDFSDVQYVDHTVHEQLHSFETEYAAAGGNVSVVGKDHLKQLAESEVSAIRASQSK